MTYAKANHNSSIPIADMEQDLADDAVGKERYAKFNTPVRIHIHSVRRRLADTDGLSAKATIDGLVHAKILKDDSPKEVKEVTYSQEKTKGKEETIITIEVI